MRHWQCLVCGFISAGEEPPENCPLCAAPRSKFREVEAPAAAAGDRAQQHLDWEDEIQAVGLLLAYGRQAEEDGYPEIAQAFYQIAREEAWHAARWAAIAGLVDRSTQENLRRHLKREDRAMEIKRQLADQARQRGDQEAAAFFAQAAADERRHRAVIASLLRRFFAG